MKHLGLSGAGFAIPGIAGASFELLIKGFKPDIISGVSSGAILAFIYTYADNPLLTIEDNITSFTSKDVFDTRPINKKGRPTIRGIFNLIFRGYFSKKTNLEKTLMRLVSEDEFNFNKFKINTPICLILCVDLLTGKRIVKNLSDLTYREAISTVVASASIPIFTKPLKTDENVLVDGGVRNHILTPYVFQNYDIKENWSIFSRPYDFQKPIKENMIRNSMTTLIRTIEIMQFELSKSDEQISDLLAKKKGIKHHTIFIERLLDNVYQEDPKKSKELFSLGKQTIRNYLKLHHLLKS